MSKVFIARRRDLGFYLEDCVPSVLQVGEPGVLVGKKFLALDRVI